MNSYLGYLYEKEMLPDIIENINNIFLMDEMCTLNEAQNNSDDNQNIKE